MAPRAMTSPELALARTPGQFSRHWLAFFKPNTIYTARLASVPSSTDMVGEISFDTGSGTLANVKKEMTLWVGSTAGARDLGICRIRKAPISGTFYIGFISDVDWQANCYLTVVDAFRIEQRQARMDAGTLKLDYEYEYSNQHSVFDPVPVLGAHAIAWLNGSTVDVEFDASDSWVFGSSISSYSWSAPGASAISGTSTATPTFTYNTTGYYTVYCTVTSSGGKSYTGIRHVFVFGSEFLPYAVELTSSPSGSLDGGGWGYGVKMYADADPTDVIEGCLAFLFSEDWYGSTKQSIGQLENRENLICGGYVAAENIRWDPEISEVEISIEGAQAWMGKVETSPITMTMATTTPASWDVMSALTVDRALWHILHWRSNVTALMDVRLTDDTRYLPTVDVKGTLWEQINDIAWGKIFALPFVDRFMRFFVSIDPQLTPEASRTWATVMTITKQDWKNQIDIRRRTNNALSMLSTSGWISNLSGTVNVLYSLAMGHIGTRYGKAEIIDKLLASSQSQFNTLAGLYMGWQNRELDFEISLGQNNRMVDIFPPQYLAISLAAGDTPRGIAYTGKLIPRSVTLEYDPDAMCFETILECEQETFAALAVNGDIPPSTGIDPMDPSTFPPFEMPNFGNLPIYTPLPPSVENPNHPKVAAIASTKGVFYTTTFDETEPEWLAMNNGLDSDLFVGTIKVLHVAPNGALWLLIHSTSDYVYRASGVGGTWTLMGTGESLGGYSILALGIDPNSSERVAVLSGVTSDLTGPVVLYTSTGGGAFSAGSSSMSVRPGIKCSIVRLGNNWYFFFSGGGGFGTPGAGILTNAGALSTSADITSAVGQDAAARFGVALPAALFEWDAAAPGGYNLIDPSTLIPTRYTGITPAHHAQAVAFSPSGVYGMACNTTGTPYVSTDGGVTWSSVAGTLSTGSDVWENCKDDNRFIFGGGTTLRLTLDRGATYVEKSGNLSYIAALIDIECIRFIA